jgi:hypothetical protein
VQTSTRWCRTARHGCARSFGACVKRADQTTVTHNRPRT